MSVIDGYLRNLRNKMKQKGLPSDFVEEFFDNYTDQLYSMIDSLIEEKALSREEAEKEVLNQCDSEDRIIIQVLQQFDSIKKLDLDQLSFKQTLRILWTWYKERVLSTMHGLAFSGLIVWLIIGFSLVIYSDITFNNPNYFSYGYPAVLAFPAGLLYFFSGSGLFYPLYGNQFPGLRYVAVVIFAFPLFTIMSFLLGYRTSFFKGASTIMLSSWAISLSQMWDFIFSMFNFMISNYTKPGYVYEIFSEPVPPLDSLFLTTIVAQFLFSIILTSIGIMIYVLGALTKHFAFRLNLRSVTRK
ncbi:MAG: hypothetical protein ACFFBD_03855 [Candidatus Hodarchaeota archaeon]